jgi:hypothetical protein
MIEILLLLLGVVIGYNIRYERQSREENLVLEQVDARVRRELEIAKNLNDSLQMDVAELKATLSAMKGPSLS